MFWYILWYVFIVFIILSFFVGLYNKEDRISVKEKWFTGSFYIMLTLGIFLGMFVYWFLAGIQTGGKFCDSPNRPNDVVMWFFCIDEQEED